MKKEIIKLCKQIEKENNVKIIFAIENGSRAWRMDSKDSDYDVRFVYKRKKDDYLTLSKEKDVINLDKGLIDMSGFDIFKYLNLLSKSNPTTIEWLMSDIVYYGKQPNELINYAKKHFSEKALYYHYKSMCKNNYIKYIKSGDLVTYKKYLYALRGLTNALYVQKYKKLPPIVFVKAIKVLPKFLQERIEKIISLKKQGKEKDIIKNIPKIDKYIENFLDKEEDLDTGNKNVEILNKYLKKLLSHS